MHVENPNRGLVTNHHKQKVLEVNHVSTSLASTWYLEARRIRDNAKLFQPRPFLPKSHRSNSGNIFLCLVLQTERGQRKKIRVTHHDIGSFSLLN
jgi:hypothetical protein